MAYKIHDFQLMDSLTGEAIMSAGGAVIVCQNGSYARATLYDPDSDFAALSQPVSFTRGHVRFAVLDTIDDVDMYGLAPGGESFMFINQGPQSKNEYWVDTQRIDHVLKVPFHMDDLTAATEFDLGLDFTQQQIIRPEGLGAYIAALDATETIDIGILSSEAGGDANGFASLLSVAALGLAQAGAVVTTGSNEVFLASTTVGALLVNFNAGTDAATDVGVHREKGWVSDGTAKSLSATITAGSDTANGLLLIPFKLMRIT